MACRVRSGGSRHCGNDIWGHGVHRTSASGSVPTGPTTHTLIAYCDRLILKAKDDGTDEVHTLSSNATLTPSEVHSVCQTPNDLAEVTTSGQEIPYVCKIGRASCRERV